MAQPYTLRFAPKDTSVLAGRQQLVQKVRDFVTKYNSQKKKALLLHGPSGVGKTSLIVALAHELDLELFELNASDRRNKNSLEEVLHPVMTTRSFFGTSKIILLDEVDGLSGKDDRGGVQSLTKLIATSQYPVIMTANDAYGDKLKALRKAVDVVEVLPLETKHMVTILNNICTKENIACDDGVLDMIARKNNSDIRGALADLEVLAVHSPITRDNVLVMDERLKTQSIEQGVTRVLKTTDPHIARTAFDAVDGDMDEWFMWLDYNVAKEYTGVVDRARAYGVLSRADIFRGRIRRRQHWRFLVYVNDLMTAGVAVAKDQPYKKPPKYKRSSRPLRIWMLNNQTAKKKSIAEKIAENTHTSTKRVLRDFYTVQTLCLQPDVQQAMHFDEAETQWLQKLNTMKPG